VTRYLIISLFLLISFDTEAQWKQGPNDTLFVPIIIDQGDTMTFGVMDMVLVWGRMNAEQRRAHREWTRLRNAVYVTYPYAKKAGAIINDVNMHLQGVTDASKRKKYLSQREKELKKEFTEPLTNLSVYQGKILMKLINRETSNTCFELVKEYRGGFSAQFWQTIAWIFGGSLKQNYEPRGADAEMERIVQEVARMYGHAS
jgi:hypothetical protein